MTKQEYDEKLKVIEENYDLLKKDLYKNFAFANNPYKVGDIITDHIGSIKIEKIRFKRPPYNFLPTSPECVYEGIELLPQCVYEGIELTKKGEPKKNESRRIVYQDNINKPL